MQDHESVNVELTLPEAARRYGLTTGYLQVRARRGEIVGAYKIRGASGRQWRIPAAALEAMGYNAESRAPEDDHVSIDQLRASLRAVSRELAFERRRADKADGELGAAALELGRLRAELGRLEIVRQPVAPSNIVPQQRGRDAAQGAETIGCLSFRYDRPCGQQRGAGAAQDELPQ